MPGFLHPLGLVGLSAATYGTLLTASRSLWPGSDSKSTLSAVTDFHSVLSCATVLYVLRQAWPVGDATPYASKLSLNLLDDSQNPLIHGKSTLGNAITAWEAGYLLYDTLAVALLQYGDSKNASIANALTRFVRKEPLTFFHHLALLGTLCYLQTYVSQGEERGVWIINAFHLMNASTPVLHWRWRQRRTTGSSSLTLDCLLALVFGTCRMGLIALVLRTYGNFHGIGAWEAYLKQRVVCQLGTGALFGVNMAWWLMLMRGIVRKLWNHEKLRS